MAVFVAGCDESAGKTHRDTFLYGGYVGPEDDWLRYFSPAWQEVVLDGPPSIPYLHMTEIRSRGWREKYGLSRWQADERVKAAVGVLDAMGSFVPIDINVDAGVWRDNFTETKVLSSSTGAARPFEPDYICFLTYAFVVLSHIRDNEPAAERVDFLVERKSNVTNHIKDFHSTLPQGLRALGKADLAELVGDLIPGEKDRIALQAADLFCWFRARSFHPETMEAAEIKLYRQLCNRLSGRIPLTHEMIRQFVRVLQPPPQEQK